MSYILDALKKVEHEKIRKTTTVGMTSISGDLFQERPPRPVRSGTGKIIVILVFVALLTFAVTWFVLKSDKKNGAAIRSEVPITVAAPAMPQKPPPAVLPAAVIPPQKAAESIKPPAKISVPPQPATAIRTVPAPADIIVTGIAWQDERAARRAVINGFLLQEGKVVSGSTILEIHQDRVKFKSPAGIFEVRMDAATLPGSPK
jgi:general secretion pathway protein B